MNSYRYKVTVEALTDGKGKPTEGWTLSFEAANHEDIGPALKEFSRDLKERSASEAAASLGRLL